MKKIRRAIGDLSTLIMIWIGLTQLHIIPSLYIGKLNTTDLVVGIVAVLVTFLFTVYWLSWIFMSMIGAIFKMKVSLLEPLHVIWLTILKR